MLEDGDFGFYSGAALKDAQNGIFFHALRSLGSDNHHMNSLHVSIDSQNGCLNINHLQANDIGIIYTDCIFDVKMIQELMERIN